MLVQINIQSMLISSKSVNNMFDRGSKVNFMAQVVIMSSHYRTQLCVCNCVFQCPITCFNRAFSLFPLPTAK